MRLTVWSGGGTELAGPAAPIVQVGLAQKTHSLPLKGVGRHAHHLIEHLLFPGAYLQ
jgi:hypothetical protein